MKASSSKPEDPCVLVVTGDPGGARVLIAGIKRFVREHPDFRISILAGPNSLPIWRRAGFRPRPWPLARIPARRAAGILAAAAPSLLATGTSFENPTESRFRAAAVAAGIPSFSVLDHWCNYRHRFELGGRRLVLPDLIGVMDPFARRQMIREGIAGARVAVIGHPVLDPFLGRRRKAGASRREALWLSEPISWNGRLDPRVIRHRGHNELTLLRALLEAFARTPEMLRFGLRIRPHPLEPLSRLRAVLARHTPGGLKVRVDRGRPLEQDFAECGVVLGITSIALLQAELMGIPVLSVQTPEAAGRIPDDILRFLPRVRSSRCLIEAVSSFVLRGRARGAVFIRGAPPRLPRDAAGRISREMEKLIRRKHA